MAFARITGGTDVDTTSATTLTVAVTPGAVGRIILVFSANAVTTTTATIADSATNTWAAVEVKFTQTGLGAAYAWYAVANGSGSTTITVTWSSNSGSFMLMLVDVFSGNDTVAPLSAHNKASGASGAPTGTVTPADDNCLIWGAAADTITAVGSGYTKGADDANQDWTEYKEISGGSGAAQTVNFSGTSGAWALAMAAIKPVAAGGSSIVPIVVRHYRQRRS